jgi:curved DNA-binding protein CbpA
VRDYFDLLGLSTTARASEIRRQSARWPRRWHPDFGAASPGPSTCIEPLRNDAAVDFVSMAELIERMQQAFFGATSRLENPGTHLR